MMCETGQCNIILSKTVSACQAMVGNYGGDQPAYRAKMEQSRCKRASQVSNLTMPPCYEWKLRSPFPGSVGMVVGRSTRKMGGDWGGGRVRLGDPCLIREIPLTTIRSCQLAHSFTPQTFMNP